MGDRRPITPDINGDESVLEPRFSNPSLLGAQRATDQTRRLETDADNNLFVNVAAGSLVPSGTQNVNIVNSITLDVLGPLTDTQLRASPVPVDTELPAASALVDADANPTTSRIGANNLVYNGATWDRQRGNATDGTLVNQGTGTWANGAQTAVAATAVQVLAANANRKRAIIQNVGSAAVRVGITGVGVTTGLRLIAGAAMILEKPNVETNAIFAIQDGALGSTVFAQETV